MKSRWQEIEKENPWLETEYYDFDKSKEMTKKYKIDKVLPVFVFLDKNEKEILRLRGEIGKKELLKIIGENKEK
jgi:thioredoxin-related protein